MTRVEFAFRFFGAIAQLGERLHGMQEVAGSIPASSTKYAEGPVVPALLFLR